MSELVVEVQGLVKRFGAFAAVDGLDLSVEAGEVHGFLGPNGAGKSTTIRVLLGLARPTDGRVRVFGQDPATDAAAITRCCSYVPGDVTLWANLTGQEVLDALGGLRGAYDVAVERRLIEEFALDPTKKVRAYSRGNRQKVALITAFAARTELLVLDEPTSGLDPLMGNLFRRCVADAAAEGRTVLLSSHVLSEVEQLCESVTIIRDGTRIESGRLTDLQHLAASNITATVDLLELDRLVEVLGDDGVEADLIGRLRIAAPRARVASVLSTLIEAGAQDITCTPATLEDLFLRHYQAAAR